MHLYPGFLQVFHILEDTPRRSWQSSIMFPTNSTGVKMSALTIGSLASAMAATSG